MKKSLLAAAGVTSAVALGSITGFGVASAAANTSSSSGGNDPFSSLVSAIATKFNLKTADVQAVFDAQRIKMEAARTEEIKTKLAELVKTGKLTQAQSDAIIAKRAELEKTREANRSSMDSKTDTERKAAIETERAALKTWLTSQGISTDYEYLLSGGHRGPGGPPPGDDNSTTTSKS